MRRVLLDVDGVLADFVGAYLQLLESKLGILACREQIDRFDIGAALGLTRDQSSRMKREIDACPGIARSLDVCPGAREGLHELQRVADVWIVTSPWNSNPTWCHDREAWLHANFDIPHSRVTHTAAKHLMRGDYLVDDKVSTLEAWQAEYPDGVAVCWSTPHNQLDGWRGARTCDWAQLAAMVQR